MTRTKTTLPTPIKTDSRICFGIAYFASEAEATRYAAYVRSKGYTYNGGFFDGMSCGRERARDYDDPALGRLFAVTE